MSPYFRPHPIDDCTVHDPSLIVPGESHADTVDRIERAVQDGLCPKCGRPLWPAPPYQWVCPNFGCRFLYERDDPMPILN